MPQKVQCSECKHTLYEGDMLKTPSDIIKQHDGRCGNCGKKLEFGGTNSVCINPVDESIVVSIENMNERREEKRKREPTYREKLTDVQIFEELYKIQKRDFGRPPKNPEGSYKND